MAARIERVGFCQTDVALNPRPIVAAGATLVERGVRSNHASRPRDMETKDEQQSRRRVSRAGQGGSAIDRLSEDGRSAWPGNRSRRDTQGGEHEYLRLRPAHGAWPDHRRSRPRARPRDHRRGDRNRARRRNARDRRSGVRAVQRRLRTLPDLQGAAYGRVPERESVACGRRVRLCRHGRLDRRAGRIRDGSVRRLQSAEVPGSRAGDVEDPRPHVPLRYPADGLSRRRDGGRQARRDGLYRGRGAGRDGGGRFGAARWARRARSSAT